VQQRVGEQLRNESVSGASGVLALLHLQLGVAFVLGLLAAGLAMTLGLKPPTIRPGPHRDLH
jgi:hypothetical protein